MTTESQPDSGRPGCLQVMGVLTLLLLLAMLVLGVLAWNSVGGLFGGVRERIDDVVDSIEAFPQTVADKVQEALEIETRASMETRVNLAESIKDMGILVTASHSGDAVVHKSIRSGILNICGVSVNHYAEGTIEAGVDLSQVSASDFSNDTRTLILGRARIHSCRIDFIQQQNHSLTFCGQDWDDYRLLAEAEALKEILKEVLAEGLLNNAERVASQMLESFLGSITGSEEVRVVFDSAGPEPDLPESCLREPPSGWIFDEESDTWKRE